MTNFTKRARSESKKSIGNAKIKVATANRGTFGDLDKMSNQDVLDMTRSGVTDLLEGTREVNKMDAESKAQTTDAAN